MKKLFDSTKHTKWYITDGGRVFSESSFKGRSGIYEKKTNKHKRGYIYARTTNGNYQVHRLVACAFIPNPENKPTVNHIDCNKHNNNVSNLEWATYKENCAHATKNGLVFCLGKNEGGNLKYTNEQCADVIAMVNSGMFYIKAGEKYNMPYSTVAHLIRGSRRKI
jgi:hypothetical protein